MDVFNEWMPGPNQLDRVPEAGAPVQAADLLAIPEGRVTEEGFQRNIEISLIYLESWLRGIGCVPIFHLMEDAATAEISRAQLWQWNRYAQKTVDGRIIDGNRIRAGLAEILEKHRAVMGDAAFKASKFNRAGELLLEFTDGPFRSFLTTELYGELT